MNFIMRWYKTQLISKNVVFIKEILRVKKLYHLGKAITGNQHQLSSTNYLLGKPIIAAINSNCGVIISRYKVQFIALG